MKKILLIGSAIGLFVLVACSWSGGRPSSAKEMEYGFPDGTVVKYECDGEVFVEPRVGPSEAYCEGELINVSCHLRIEDDEPLYFYHLEEIDCDSVREEHPEVFL